MTQRLEMILVLNDIIELKSFSLSLSLSRNMVIALPRPRQWLSKYWFLTHINRFDFVSRTSKKSVNSKNRSSAIGNGISNKNHQSIKADKSNCARVIALRAESKRLYFCNTVNYYGKYASINTHR